VASKTKGLPAVKDVSILVGTEEEQVVAVKKLPLGRAVELSHVIESIPARLQEITDNSKVQEFLKGADLDKMGAAEFGTVLVEFLPTLINIALDLVIELLAVGTGLEEDLLEQIGLDEATELLVAIFEVNNIQAIWGNFQKLQTMFRPAKSEQTEESKLQKKERKPGKNG